MAPAASIPGLLGLFHNEWDALMLENHQLRQQLTLNRQELAHALYQHDASCRVIARLLRERNEAREALAAVQAAGGGAGRKRVAAGEADGEEGAKRARGEEAGGAIPAGVLEAMVAKSGELSSVRKKHKVPTSLATAEQLGGYKVAAHPLHKTRKGGINSLDSATDAGLIATGGDDTQVLVFDKGEGRVVGTLTGHSKKVHSVRFVGGASAVLSASADHTVRLWAQVSSEQGRMHGLQHAATSLDRGPSGQPPRERAPSNGPASASRCAGGRGLVLQGGL